MKASGDLKNCNCLLRPYIFRQFFSKGFDIQGIREVAREDTEYTQSGNCRFMAYIPSWWKNQPWLVRWGGGGFMPAPFHSSYHHAQSCSVWPSWEGRYTPSISSLPSICTLWSVLLYSVVLQPVVLHRPSVRIVTKSPKIGPPPIFSISLVEGEGRWWARSQMIRPRESLFSFYKSFKTLCPLAFQLSSGEPDDEFLWSFLELLA